MGTSDAELLDDLRDISPDEELALRNVAEMAQMAADEALHVFVPAAMRAHYAGDQVEFQRYIRGFFCLTLQLGATHHDARAKRLAAKGK